MSDNFLWLFFGAVVLLGLVVGAIMMVFFGKSLEYGLRAAGIISIVVPFVLGTIYGMFISPSRYDDV